MIVKDINIREIFATNSLKTLEIELESDKGSVRSSVPIGTSRGKYEAIYLSTDKAVRQFAVLKRSIRTGQFDNQNQVDGFLRNIDRTPNFSELGGNLALAISSAFLKAFALDAGMEVFEYLANARGKKAEMPKPLCNVAGKWNSGDIQEFLLLPVHQDSFISSVTKITDAYREIGDRLKEADSCFSYGKNIESAWVTALPADKVLQILKAAADKRLLKIGIDVAASHLWNGQAYAYGNESMGRSEQVAFISKLTEDYPISYVEDPFHEDDFLGFSILAQRLVAKGKLVCGDDLYATSKERLLQGIAQKSTNAVIVKPNQVCTITDMIAFVAEAQKHEWKTVMSHRSGETEDTLICHMAVGLGCDYAKIGISGERAAKINEMIRIEEKLRV